MIKHWVTIFFLFAPLLGMTQAKCGQVGYGSPHAPLKIVEYASPSCTICSEFSKEIFPKMASYLKEKKIHLTVINLPYNAIDLRVCAFIEHSPNPQKFNTLIYQHQKEWLFSKLPIPNLVKFLKKEGMSEAQIKKSFRNKKLEDCLIQQRIIREEKHAIAAIPMLIIGQKKIVGLMPWEKLKLVIEEALQHIKDGNPIETFGQVDEIKQSRRKTPPFKKGNPA